MLWWYWSTVVPATKDRPFCGLWVVFHRGAVSYRVQNVLKILFGLDKGRSHKTSRSHNRGSFVAGTTVYRKKDRYPGIEITCKNECIIWLRLKSTFFKIPQDTHKACVYYSPHDSTYIHNTDARTDYFNILFEELSCKNTSVYIFVDFNARTGQLDDNVDIFTGSDGPLANLIRHSELTDDLLDVTNLESRVSSDVGINEYGKNLIDFCKCTGIRIMNGRISNKQDTGDFTCYKKKKGIGYTRGLHHIRTIGASPNVADCVATLTLDFGLCFFSEF